MSNAISKINRDLHRCNRKLRRSIRTDAHKAQIDRNRKHWTRFELKDAAQQIRRVS